MLQALNYFGLEDPLLLNQPEPQQQLSV
jgi:hypothetical protein